MIMDTYKLVIGILSAIAFAYLWRVMCRNGLWWGVRPDDDKETEAER